MELKGSDGNFMKNLITHTHRLSILGAICCIPLAYALGADTNSAPANLAPETPAATSAPLATDFSVEVKTDSTKWPYGTADVVKLSRSQVGEEVIVSYVQNSGIAYSLSPDDIVRLRSEGVSDRVINTMLDQHGKAVRAAQMAAAPAAPVYSDNPGGPVVSETQPPQNSGPGPVAEAPLTPPASSTYVIPYPPATSAYYGYPSYYYPYYPYYYGGYYGGPIVSFRFGFGGGHGYYGGHGHYGGHHH